MKCLSMVLFFVVPFLMYSQSSEDAKSTEIIDSVAQDWEHLSEIIGRLNSEGKLKEALFYSLQQVEVSIKEFGKTHENYGHSLNNVGILYGKLGEYQKALPFFEDAVNNFASTLGTDDLQYGAKLKNLATLYMMMGSYNKAEKLFLESIEIIKYSDKSSPAYPSGLDNLAGLYRQMGKLEKALPLAKRSLILTDSLFGKNHDTYSIRLNNTSLIYQALGQYEKALPLVLEAIDIVKRNHGEKHPYYCVRMLNVGGIYREMNDLDNALISINKGKSIIEEIFEADHPYQNIASRSLSLVYMNMGEFENALPLLEEAMSLARGLGESHAYYTSSLNDLGMCYFRLKNYDKAVLLLAESVEKTEEYQGKFDSHYKIRLKNLISIYRHIGEDEASIELLERYNEVIAKTIATTFPVLSDSGKNRLLDKVNSDFDVSYSLTYDFYHSQPGLVEMSCNNNLLMKSILLFNKNKLAKNIKEKNDTILTRQYEAWLTSKQILAKQYSLPVSRRFLNVDSLEQFISEVEENIILLLDEFAQSLKVTNWKEVRGALKDGEATIEFLSFNYHKSKPTDSIIYAALLTLPHYESPRFIPLFEERELEVLINDQYENKIDYYSQLYGKGINNKGLYQLIWQPMKDLLDNVETVYVSPSGLLHRINLSAIMSNDSQVFSDEFRVVNVGSTRQLTVKQPQTTRAQLTASVYGGIHYDIDTTTSKGQKERSSTVAFGLKNSLGSSGLEPSGDPERGKIKFNFLIGTDKEADIVSRIIEEKGGEVRTLKGDDASEYTFKQLGRDRPAPAILHLATHGYFYPDLTEEISNSPLINEAPAFKVSSHPLIRSGLIMAGGNYCWQNGQAYRPDMEDGILTAYEVSQSNLNDTEVVILSACQTGLGDIKGNEGVYGLQRAFRIAGVDKIIMSLWSVPDEQTHQMMVLFYQYWLEEDFSLREAFQKAQNEMRGKFPNPYYWAAFVLVE